MSQAQPNSLVDRLDALYEFDREPVSEKKLHGHKTFIAMFAGEHVAGTEFVLGPLMLAHGVTATDFFGGLLVGNLLAVLSWALLCAPVAVKTRLTIYWQLRRIAGPYVTILYSALYAIILCVLAGSMVAVSTTAVSLLFQGAVPNPAPTDLLPSVPWMAVAAVVGVVIAVLAVLGFEKLAHFSKICAPWMALVFLASGIAVLPMLGVTHLGDIWKVFNEQIFTGVPFEGFSKYTFWHVAGFAWLCNAAQHLGMSDITIFRYAKKWTSGFASAFGMYIGHFMAWVSSALLCAAYVKLHGNESFPPGEIAFLGTGIAGAVCVVIAGWTTANPTLYRAGLAIQVATPNWHRWKVTLLAGVAMILFAWMPAVVSSLDVIVAHYGLFFLPLGACIFTDLFIFPKIGLKSNYAETMKLSASMPALFAWLLSFGICKAINVINPNYEIMFMALPCWLLAAALYTGMSFFQQKAAPAPHTLAA